MKIRKGDTVLVTAGKDRGKQGKVEKVLIKGNLVVVPGVNQYKKHRKGQGGQPGEILTLSRPLGMGKVAVICPKCKKQTRIGYEVKEGKKVRVCRKCDQAI